MSVVTHHDAEGFEDVEFAHGTGAVLVQPGVHTHFMEDVSNKTQKTRFNKQDKENSVETFCWGFRLTCRAEFEPHHSAGTLQYTLHSG